MRARAQVATSPQPGMSAAIETAVLDGFVATWNEACAPLPRLLKTPSSEPKLRLIRQAVAYFEGDMSSLALAIRRAASDDLYQRNHHGFESFCRHVERWAPMTATSPNGNGHRRPSERLDGHGVPLPPRNPAIEAAAAALAERYRMPPT